MTNRVTVFTMTGTADSKVWFITGATAGLGLALTRQALDAGDSVVALARDVSPLAEVADHGNLCALAVDVSDAAAVQQAASAAVGRFGRIDVVATNAGIGVTGATEEISDAQARAVFDVNVFGVYNVLRALLPILREQGSGHILQGSSVLGQTVFPGVGLISATKYAVEGIADALIGEVEGLGIKVTMVEPGPMDTTFNDTAQSADNPLSLYDPIVRVPQDGGPAASSPARVAAAIRTIVASANPPHRVALGTISAQAMRAALDARIADLDAWEDLSTAVDR